MHLKIVSSLRLIFDGKVTTVTLPGELGSLGILRGHTPLLARLTSGDVKVRILDRIERYPIKSGLVEVANDRIVVIAEE